MSIFETPSENKDLEINDIVDVITSKTSVGGLIGETGYTSASSPVRYNNISNLLSQNNLPGINSENLNGKIKVRECACGKGLAITKLVEGLSQNLEVEVDLFDILDPQTLLNNDKMAEIARYAAINSVESHSVTQPYESEADISIMGYVLPYLSPEDLHIAIENVLSNSKVLAIIPADASSQAEGKLSTLYIWKENGKYCYRYVYSELN